MANLAEPNIRPVQLTDIVRWVWEFNCLTGCNPEPVAVWMEEQLSKRWRAQSEGEEVVYSQISQDLKGLTLTQSQRKVVNMGRRDTSKMRSSGIDWIVTGSLTGSLGGCCAASFSVRERLVVSSPISTSLAARFRPRAELPDRVVMGR